MKISREVMLHISVHGSIPHHERNHKYLRSLSTVRPEVYPPSAAPASQRLVKGDQGIEGRTRVNAVFCEIINHD